MRMTEDHHGLVFPSFNFDETLMGIKITNVHFTETTEGDKNDPETYDTTVQMKVKTRAVPRSVSD